MNPLILTLPPLPRQLPKTNADWERLLNVFQSWQTAIQNIGVPQSVPFDAANFSGNGSMTWTVVSAGQSTFWYALVGQLLVVNFDVSGTAGGTPDSQLLITVPGNFTVLAGAINPVLVVTNGTAAIGYAFASISTPTVIAVLNSAAGNVDWTAGTVEVYGQIAFQVSPL